MENAGTVNRLPLSMLPYSRPPSRKLRQLASPESTKATQSTKTDSEWVIRRYIFDTLCWLREGFYIPPKPFAATGNHRPVVQPVARGTEIYDSLVQIR
eukprot:1270910-Amorphochlora_amoeboformis.AAC.4